MTTPRSGVQHGSRRGDAEPPTDAPGYAAFYAALAKALALACELASAMHQVNESRRALSDVLEHVRGLVEAMPEPQAAKDQFTALLALLELRLGTRFEPVPARAGDPRPDPAQAPGNRGGN